MSSTTTETIPPWKREEVENLIETLQGATSVGIVNVAGIPSRQLQLMRRDLHGSATLRVSRNTFIERALEEVDEGLEELLEFVSGPIGLILTEENPFTLYRKLEASKTPAPISAGETAPNDIVIEEQDTGIDPGPFVGDLQSIGVPARIDAGSIHVLETTTVCEAGEEVTTDVASVLNELELEPKEVGLDLQGVFADGVVFLPEELKLDIDEYRAQFATAGASARGLALEIAYPAPGVIAQMLSRADAQAVQVAVAAGIIEPETANAVFGAAVADGRALAGAIGDEEVVPADTIPGGPAEPVSESEPADATESDEPEATEADDDDEEDDEAAAEGLGNLFG